LVFHLSEMLIPRKASAEKRGFIILQFLELKLFGSKPLFYVFG